MSTTPDSFQSRVEPWLLACFGETIAGDKVERNHRFLEEALELVQSCGCTQSEAHQLVDYVFSRPVGDPPQETGGVMVTLAALCRAQGLNMHEAGDVELARIWTKVEAIRAKQAAKPKHSPLPQVATQPAALGGVPALPPFKQEWAKKEAAGYRYGRDALEQVRMGYRMAQEALSAAPAQDAPSAQDARDAEIETLKGERGVLIAIIRECDQVISTLEPESADEAEGLRQVLRSIKRITMLHQADERDLLGALSAQEVAHGNHA